jgi:hypothetical protein
MALFTSVGAARHQGENPESEVSAIIGIAFFDRIRYCYWKN